jgi:hypothetical protein
MVATKPRRWILGLFVVLVVLVVVEVFLRTQTGHEEFTDIFQLGPAHYSAKVQYGTLSAEGAGPVTCFTFTFRKGMEPAVMAMLRKRSVEVSEVNRLGAEEFINLRSADESHSYLLEVAKEDLPRYGDRPALGAGDMILSVSRDSTLFEHLMNPD